MNPKALDKIRQIKEQYFNTSKAAPIWNKLTVSERKAFIHLAVMNGNCQVLGRRMTSSRWEQLTVEQKKALHKGLEQGLFKIVPFFKAISTFDLKEHDTTQSSVSLQSKYDLARSEALAKKVTSNAAI